MVYGIMVIYAAIVKSNHATFPRGIGGVIPTLPHHFLWQNKYATEVIW